MDRGMKRCRYVINRIKCKLKNLGGRYMSIHIILSTVCMFGDGHNTMEQNY